MNNFRILVLLLFVSFISCKNEKKEILSIESPELNKGLIQASSDTMVNTQEEIVIPTEKKEAVVETQNSTQVKEEKSINNIDKRIKNKTQTISKDTLKEDFQETNPVTNVQEPIHKVEEKVTQPKSNLKAEIIKVNSADFNNRITGRHVQLIDVRTPKEFKDSHIKNAKNINIYDSDFISQATLKLDKSKPVYVYCRSGIRSMKSAKKLKNAGYKVYNLNGGIFGWKRNGNKVEK